MPFYAAERHGWVYLHSQQQLNHHLRHAPNGSHLNSAIDIHDRANIYPINTHPTGTNFASILYDDVDTSTFRPRSFGYNAPQINGAGEVVHHIIHHVHRGEPILRDPQTERIQHAQQFEKYQQTHPAQRAQQVQRMHQLQSMHHEHRRPRMPLAKPAQTENLVQHAFKRALRAIPYTGYHEIPVPCIDPVPKRRKVNHTRHIDSNARGFVGPGEVVVPPSLMETQTTAESFPSTKLVKTSQRELEIIEIIDSDDMILGPSPSIQSSTHNTSLTSATTNEIATQTDPNPTPNSVAEEKAKIQSRSPNYNTPETSVIDRNSLQVSGSDLVIPSAHETHISLLRIDSDLEMLLCELGVSRGSEKRVQYERIVYEIYFRARRDAYNEITQGKESIVVRPVVDEKTIVSKETNIDSGKEGEST